MGDPIFNNSKLKLYYYYMYERNSVYVKKEILHEEYPWTDDTILRNNSFTCVKRWLDRTSKYLIDNISTNSNLSFSDKIWRTIVFRLYNKIETADMINISSERFWEDISQAMNTLDNYSNDPFTRAYKVIRPKYAYRNMSPTRS